MADINKSALLILNDDATKFLALKKADASVPHWLMPGGKIEDGETFTEAAVREIMEELGCSLDEKTMSFVGEYEAPASGAPDKTVNIKLYTGRFTGMPEARSEIRELGWLSKESVRDEMVSEIIREKIIPDLVSRKILK